MTAANIHSQKLIILDFGSQYTQLIARRIRELGVYCEIWDYEVDEKYLKEFAPQGMIFSGGPESGHASESPKAPEFLYEFGVPILGICYGMQTMAEQFGGKVASSDKSEFGFAHVEVTGSNKLLSGIEDRFIDNGNSQLDVWMSHGDKVIEAPQEFSVMASTESAPIAAMCNETKAYVSLSASSTKSVVVNHFGHLHLL